MIKKKKEVKKFKLIDKILIALNFLILAYFMIYFALNRYYEFFIYAIFIFFVILFMVKLHKKYRFSTFVLVGVTILQLVHKLGRTLVIDGKILYQQQLIEGILRFDKVLHFWGIFVFTLVGFYLLKPYIKDIKSKKIILLVLFLFGVGIGTGWELLEYFIVLTKIDTGIGGYANTMGDILANTVGSLCAVAYLHFKGKLKNFS
jgi:VanZ family protein